MATIKDIVRQSTRTATASGRGTSKRVFSSRLGAKGSNWHGDEASSRRIDREEAQRRREIEKRKKMFGSGKKSSGRSGG